MAKRETLKQRLKAADRRRHRRQADVRPQDAVARTTATDRVDAADLIVRTILEGATGSRGEARDVMVVAAMNSALRGSTPSGDEAKRLAEALNQIPAEPGVSMRAFREALQQLLATASANHDPKRGDAFLGYVSMLSDSN